MQAALNIFLPTSFNEDSVVVALYFHVFPHARPSVFVKSICIRRLILISLIVQPVGSASDWSVSLNAGL